MKIYNKQVSPSKELSDELLKIRARRNFKVKDYINKKVKLINQYYKEHKLSGAVIGVSGGIDSAVVLALLVKASQEKNSPLKKIVPVFLPVFDKIAATNQQDSTLRGKELCSLLKVEGRTLDLSLVHRQLSQVVCEGVGIAAKPWALGQLVAYTRTPALYYITSLLAQEGLPALVCGTTNKDEGLYLGYFGKASDGMVDLQVISDIHKSEVYEVAKTLGVPESILKVTPSGDMYDGRVDEEVFGASYDFVELYLTYLEYSLVNQNKFKNSLSKSSLRAFNKLSKNLDSLHKYNRHKYLVGSPAVHLDLFHSKIKEGWKVNGYEK